MKNGSITIFGYMQDIGNENFEECLIDLKMDYITEEEKTRLRNTITADGWVITREYFPETDLSAPNFINTITI